jgi:hypothetical protein
LSKNEKGIECTQTLLGKAIPPLLLFLAVILFTNVWAVSLLGWTLIAYLGLCIFVASPDFTIYDEGIEIDFIIVKRFVEWEEIKLIRKTSVNTRIHSKKLTIFNYLSGLGMRAIIITPLFRKNYKLAIEFMKHKLPERFVETI